VKRYRVKPGSKVNLRKWDPEDREAFSGDKKQGQKALERLDQELDDLQYLLSIDRTHKLLVVLQGMDSSGKDGTIRHIFRGVNPQGVKVASFKVPSVEEAAHDYLWRIHQKAPANGEIVIFNRSHYEDVLVVRVHKLVPREVWSRRFEEINDFERMLSNEGTAILKFFLHIDKKEQEKRLEARVDDPKKHWKLSMSDAKERELWSDYQSAYEDVLSKTSTPWAPWYIIPSNTKWYRNWVIAAILVETLKSLRLHYPEPPKDLRAIQKELA